MRYMLSCHCGKKPQKRIPLIKSLLFYQNHTVKFNFNLSMITEFRTISVWSMNWTGSGHSVKAFMHQKFKFKSSTSSILLVLLNFMNFVWHTWSVWPIPYGEICRSDNLWLFSTPSYFQQLFQFSDLFSL